MHFLYYKCFKHSVGRACLIPKTPHSIQTHTQHVWVETEQIQPLTNKHTLPSASVTSHLQNTAEGKPSSCLCPVYKSVYRQNNKIKSTIMLCTWVQSQHQTNHTIEEGMPWHENTPEGFPHNWLTIKRQQAIKFTDSRIDNVCHVFYCTFVLFFYLSFLFLLL